MLDSISSFFKQLLEAPPAPILAICIASSVLLLVPEALGIVEFVNTYRNFIVIVCLVAWSLLLSYLLCWLREQYVSWSAKSTDKKIKQTHLEELTQIEKSYLAPFITSDVNTQNFVIDDGVAGGLVAKGILYRSSDVIEPNRVPHNINPWAKRHLKAYPELLEGAKPLPVVQPQDVFRF